MHRLIFVAALSIVSVAGAAVCYSGADAYPSPKHSMADRQSEQKILEAVFKYQIRGCGKDFHSKIYFLSYKAKDPPDEVVARFADYGGLVRKRSQMRGYRDIETGEQGILLSITRIGRRGSTLAQVSGSCAAGSLEANDYTYRVRRTKRGWRVTRQRLVGVS
jgi:hypothetical protein